MKRKLRYLFTLLREWYIITFHKEVYIYPGFFEAAKSANFDTSQIYISGYDGETINVSIYGYNGKTHNILYTGRFAKPCALHDYNLAIRNRTLSILQYDI